jgi:hypothetical protein
MNIKQWIKLQEQEATERANLPHVIIDDDGNERDVKMSQAYADEYFFNLANSDMEKIIPKFDMDSAIYALAHNCLVRLYLSLGEDMVDAVLEQAQHDAVRVQKRLDSQEDDED